MSIEKIEAYIKEKEENNWLNNIAELLNDKKEDNEDKEKFDLFWWLKNDKNLLDYAKLFNKPEKLNIWESIKFKILEVKLSITCPYFADFKEFLKELKNWTDTSVDKTNNQNKNNNNNVSESIDLSKSTFCWASANNIKSEPFQKNSKTWVTWCSKTARFNWYNFGISLPSWDAYNAWNTPWKDSISTIPAWKRNQKPNSSRESIKSSDFKSVSKWNFADIYTNSKSWYWHRAVAFRADNWEWYVLDPYTRVNWKLDNSPKKLEDYLKARKIVKANLYESKWYEKKSDHDDKWSWYEWKNS